MENMNPESLLRKAQALGDDIKEMESIDVLGAYCQAQTRIKANRKKSLYNQLMRYAAFLTLPLLLSSLILGYLYFGGVEAEEKYRDNSCKGIGDTIRTSGSFCCVVEFW